MCQNILATFPSHLDLNLLTEAIPPRVRRSLLRGGMKESWPQPIHFGFSKVESNVQLPYPDETLVTCTRVSCDCWSTLTSLEPNRKELRRWMRIFEALHTMVPRFGFMIHFGNPSDDFEVRGPVPLSIRGAAPLHHFEFDTYYDLTS